LEKGGVLALAAQSLRFMQRKPGEEKQGTAEYFRLIK
jgi:hypothetical protein